ncbi:MULTISPECIES: hypothetical protein [unclassified Pseudomonas]|uniref:hypothetical protein n=1 Tax=unclassified Pseudomonas TaxID=196821 RepID=UPI00244CB4CD|nr:MULTISPECIES: hypothetical protein [unclassified Pseudomonas]MDG9925435.1 hypothetical protein [Pseudomonas sp. GD04045]MDH0034124.1 hypothetical protein [Pseudomonas sp. GD04019]
MPKIIVTAAFNFREGPKTTTYKPSKEEQEVSAACAAHAVGVLKAAHYPKAKAELKPAQASEPPAAG